MKQINYQHLIFRVVIFIGLNSVLLEQTIYSPQDGRKELQVRTGGPADPPAGV